jgi:hypothetical protein
MKCLKRYSAKAIFVLTSEVGWKLPTFPADYIGSVLFSPCSHVRDPRVPSSPPREVSGAAACRLADRPAAPPENVGDEPAAAPSASSQFFTSSWPSSSSSSNPRRRADGNGAAAAGVGEPTGAEGALGEDSFDPFP